MPNDDQRAAVAIEGTLSGQVMSASLAMIAIEGALVTFILDKRDVGTAFYVVYLLSFGCFILSIISGGKGIARLSKAGFGGNWSLGTAKDAFNLQALLTLVGSILFLVSVVFLSGRSKSNSDKEDIRIIKEMTRRQDDSLRMLDMRIRRLEEGMRKAASPRDSNTVPQ